MGSSFYTCYLLLSWPVGNLKLFIHTEAQAVPGHKVEVKAEDEMPQSWPLTRLINIIPNTTLSTCPLFIVLIITLCINDESFSASGARRGLHEAPKSSWKQA